MIKFNNYDEYWGKRLKEKPTLPLPAGIPSFLIKYTAYGSILNQIPKESKILDLGCGNGSVSKLYLRNGKVAGVDISQKALEEAKKNGIIVRKHNLNIFPYPLSDATFDVVILTDVIEHLINPTAVLRECKRLLKNNGRLILTVPNFARLGNRLRMLKGDPIDILHFNKYGDEMEHLHWFTQPKLVYLTRQSGYKEINFVPTGLQSLGFLFGLCGLPGLGKFLTAVLIK